MIKNKAMVLLAGALLAMPGMLQAQGVTPTAGKGGTVSADQLTQRYANLAGGQANAKSLVNGLRTGSDITLAGAAPAPVYERVLLGTERLLAGTTPPQDGKEYVLVRTEQVQVGTGVCPPPKIGMCPIFQTYAIYEVYQSRLVPPPPGGGTLTFSPGPAAPMGFGNVDIALALTEAKLAPSTTAKPQELKDALVEILNKRAAGEGWGEIAKTYGFQLK